MKRLLITDTMEPIDVNDILINSVMEQLRNPKKLDRDKGVSEVQRITTNAGSQTINLIKQRLLEEIEIDGSTWEAKHGCLLGLKMLYSNPTASKSTLEDSTDERVTQLCLSLLNDAEVRVRLAAGELLGVLCEFYGPIVYEQCSNYVLSLIKENLERETTDIQSDDSEKFRDHIGGTIIRRGSIDKKQIFHDTAGWKCLETSIKCLQSMIDGCGINFRPYIDENLLELLFKAMRHTNRFVRETSCYVIGSLVSCGGNCRGEECAMEENEATDVANPFVADKYGHIVAQRLAIGLTDNWSQVRLAASEATRKFLVSFSNKEDREIFFPEILPQMCLNRYYVADGVRIYSQETWRRIAKTEGRELVEKYITNVVSYYISQTRANNHAVREAACACIAELGSKIKPEVVKPCVPQLLETLLVCFQDDSWPVRDAACLASGNFIVCFPNESRDTMKQLYPLFILNLKDCIPSVRQGAAGSLANVVKAYGDEALLVLDNVIKQGLEGVENQPSESDKYGNIDKGPATFSVVKKLRDNDEELHTDKQMYSCGSLAPKMGGGGGCSDHRFKKDPEPWEFADGCLHLIAELSQLTNMSKKVEQYLPTVANACQKRHYTHHLCLLETLCKRLTNIAKGIGKREFKQYLELFLDSLFYSLTCDNALTSSAASQCLNQLSNLLGINILRARIQEFNPNYVQQFDSNTHIAAF